MTENFMDNDEAFKKHLDDTKWDCIPDEFVVFDLETTGLTPQSDSIVEIGAILFRKDLYLRTGEVNQFQCFVKQEKPIPKDAIAIHGITDEMVANGDSEYAALTEFFIFIGSLPVYAYNSKFDRDFIRATAKRCGYFDENFKLDAKDIMPMVSEVFEDLPNKKLTTVAKHIGHPVQNSHRALDDCAMALHVFINCIQKAMIRESVLAREMYLDLKHKTEELQAQLDANSAQKFTENKAQNENGRAVQIGIGIVILIFIFLAIAKM